MTDETARCPQCGCHIARLEGQRVRLATPEEVASAYKLADVALVPREPTEAMVDAFMEGSKTMAGLTNNTITQLETQRQQMSTDLMAAMEKTGEKGQRLLEIEKSLGIDQDLNKLKEINMKIAERQAYFDKQAQLVGGQNIASGIMSGEPG